ncbi:MAG: hypothetical protein AABZ60_03400, partial [Planctomycetota bacterium]
SEEFLATSKAMEMMGQQAKNQQNPIQGISNAPSPKEQAELFLKAQKLISEASGELKQATKDLEKPELPTAMKNQQEGIKLLDEAYKLFQDKNQNQQKNKDEQEKQEKDQEKQDQNQDQEKQKEENKEGEKDQEKQDQEKQEEGSTEQKKESSPQELTEEESQRLLNQIRQQQQKRQENNAKRAIGTNEYVEKDW